MKAYKCQGCKEMFDGKALWVCEDDKLRCGKCIDKVIEAHREAVMSGTSEHVESLVGEGR